LLAVDVAAVMGMPASTVPRGGVSLSGMVVVELKLGFEAMFILAA